MSRYVVGLTGGIACGKSNLSTALRAEGAQVIDADAISRAATAQGGEALPALRAWLGDRVFRGETLDRAALADIVFQDPAALKRLNGIVHPIVLEKMRREMDAYPGIVVLDAPLLYECGLEPWCDEVWCVYLPQREQIKRLTRRDGITCRAALARIHAQMPAREKARRADRVILTTGDPSESAAQAVALWRELVQKLKGDRP